MVNQRQLNGGEQGEGSGLNADKVDAKESGDLSSELGKNVSLNEYRSLENRTAQIDDKLLFELGLMRQGYPDGLLVNFYDNSKVASTTDTVINKGIDGNITLSEDFSTIETENPDDGYTDTEIRGLEINPNEDLDFIEFTTDSDFASGYTEAVLLNSSGTFLATKQINVGDTVRLEPSGVLSSGTNYYIGIWAEGSEYTRGQESYPNYPYTGNSLDVTNGFRGVNSEGESPSLLDKHYNIVSVKDPIGYKSSGSFQSVTENKSYQASKVTLTADYGLNGQSIDSIKVFDGGGTELASYSEGEIGETKTINTSKTDYYIEVKLSGDGSGTPEINNIQVGLDNE